ncbi:MAG: hypothetical protein HYW50_03315, partial [Candidatus Diapherotrites archaeon]|nr:hypothetical protein [Candidatus Diapherotrites archaeon]
SMDFFIGFTLIVLAIGLATNFFEVNALNAKEIQNQQELWRVAKTAADNLTTSTSIVCELIRDNDLTRIDFLPNCIPKNTDVTKASLGISSSYNCNISIVEGTTINFTAPPCTTPIPSEPTTSIAAIDRMMVALTTDTLNPRQIKKSDLTQCQKGTCRLIGIVPVLERSTVRIRVWKA